MWRSSWPEPAGASRAAIDEDTAGIVPGRVPAASFEEALAQAGHADIGGLHARGDWPRVPLTRSFDHAHWRDREEGRNDPLVPGGRTARAGHRPAAGPGAGR